MANPPKPYERSPGRPKHAKSGPDLRYPAIKRGVFSPIIFLVIGALVGDLVALVVSCALSIGLITLSPPQMQVTQHAQGSVRSRRRGNTPSPASVSTEGARGLLKEGLHLLLHTVGWSASMLFGVVHKAVSG